MTTPEETSLAAVPVYSLPISDLGSLTNDDHADICVKLDSQYENFTVAEVEGFRHKLSKILHLSLLEILHLCRIDNDCFQLKFQVPSFVKQKIFPLSKEQEKSLAAMGVIRLTCGEYQFLVMLSMLLTITALLTCDCRLWNEACCCIIIPDSKVFVLFQANELPQGGVGMCFLCHILL